MTQRVELHYITWPSFTNQPAPDTYGSFAVIDGVRRPIGVGEIAVRQMRRMGDGLSMTPRPHTVLIYEPCGGAS